MFITLTIKATACCKNRKREYLRENYYYFGRNTVVSFLCLAHARVSVCVSFACTCGMFDSVCAPLYVFLWVWICMCPYGVSVYMTVCACLWVCTCLHIGTQVEAGPHLRCHSMKSSILFFETEGLPQNGDYWLS